MAGVERGRGNLGARESVWGARGGKERNAFLSFPPRAPHTLSGAPKFPLPLSKPATQATVERAFTFHQSGPGSTPFVAKLKEEICNDVCRVYKTSLRICKRAAMKASFQGLHHQQEVPNSVM